MNVRGDAARPELFAGRYRLGKCLKSGHGVETYLGVDETTSTQVVLKSIVPHLIHDAARLRFEHETQVLRRLSGTGLATLYDAGVTDGHWYLVQPFMPGSTLEEILKSGPLSLEMALRIAIDVASALDIAHGAGIFHRDVKPANVIVGGTDPASPVTLIDFGFARSPLLDESLNEQLVGTVRYLAPEAAGMLAVPADERADLYALGVLLFECLAGEPPFPGETVGEVLREHLSMPVPEVGRRRPGMPRAIDAILARLLSKDPNDRYQSASAVTYDLSALLEAVRAGSSDPRLVIGRIDHRRTLTDPAFVGREAELASLMSLVDEVRMGGSGLVLLEADSGGGKTRLLSEVASQASSAGVLQLQGQGVAETGARPFEVLHGFAEDLLSHAANDDLWDSIREGVGDGAPAIAQVLPLLGPLLGVTEELDAGPEHLGEQRSLTVLHQLMNSIGDADHPVLIIFDDCQWADRLTIQLLADVFSDRAQCPPYVGVIAAFRSEEVSDEHQLRAMPFAQSVQLGRLPARAMRQLCESMAGQLPDEAINTVVRLADGNPFMGAAVLRGLFESGALLSTDRGWQVDEAALIDVQTARRSASFLVRRLELLTEDSIHVLSAGASLGKEFDFMLAAELVQHSDVAATILQDATRRRLVWIDDVTGRCSFAHDKIREALLSRLDYSERRELHSRAADAMLGMEESGASVFDVAYHLDAAGRHQAALPYALRSAETARTQHALDSALSHYRMAERGVEPEDLETRVVIAEGLGDVLALQGAYDEAEEQLTVAEQMVTDRVHQAEVEGKLGALAFKRGDIPTARRHLEGAMARLDRPVPQVFAWLLVCLVWELCVQVVHTAAPRLTVRRKPEGREEDFLAMRLHSRLAYLYWFYSGKVTCAWTHLRGLNLAERYPPSAELGQAYSEHAPVATMVPLFNRSLKYAKRSQEIRRDRGDIWGQGQSQSFAGVALYAASKFDEAEEASREAIRLLESTGDQWEMNTAGWNLAMCLHRKGQLREAAATAKGVYESAIAIGDQTSAGVGLSVWTRAACGDVDPRLIDAELARESMDASTTAELRLAAGIAAHRAGDLAAAIEHLDLAAETIRTSGLRQEYAAPVACWRATAARTLAEQASPHDPSGYKEAVRKASKAVHSARFWAFSYRNNAPHALREAALIASLRNRPRRRERYLARSLAVAEKQGALYEAALTRLAAAEIRMRRGDDHGEVVDARLAVYEFQGSVIEDETPEAPSVSLFDRFNTLLSVGRTITAAASMEAVDVAIREAALTLLRGDTCHIISADATETANPTTESGESVDLASRTLLERAISGGVPVVSGDSAVGVSESLVMSDIRSVLAAPIIVHGETRYCFYVTHRQISALFGEEEIQLAAFVATLAGAAFEHLEGTETRYRSLARNSSDVLTLVGRDGIVSYQSSSASRVFALPANGMVGRPIDEWVHPEDRDLLTDALQRASLHSDTRVECRFLHATGSYVYAETVVTDLLDDPAVSALVLNSRDITDRRLLEDELRERALHDSLTGLPNRAHFLERAQQAINRRDPRPLVACFLDLDDFKSVNDTYGHGAGDELLCEMSERLLECLRPEDVVARFGGDEFALLFEDTTLKEALSAIERIQAATGRPVRVAGTELVCHFSIGVAPSSGRKATTDQLLAEADVAMYAAKSSGTHLCRVYEPPMRDLAESRSVARGAIDRALSQGEFLLHYQPIVNLQTEECLGVEALIRWQHPERGLLPAAEFIDLAEVSGHMPAIGAWVIETACAAAVDLAEDLSMSINVSPQQLQQPQLAQSVERALSRSGLRPDRLVLELTETTDITDPATAIEQLRQLDEMGVKLALDDFGTGYASLDYLKRFPVQILKIDQEFVQHIHESEDDRAIVRGIIELAKSFGLRTIAEGVEQIEQQRVVTELGCDFGQGFLWSRPGLPENLPEVFLPSSAA
ncbi:diguanylate cyclase (GGDEF)-like protein/PAS domain S-box-containing protein [Aeromicrobium panaciterrae]|uniref:Diguanylate cyclase (GGDEF)-like protein/PAS domain S-box-containing protein n=1 Tax=Aeromicrobium panaciterrae TaxID=363861 RepID=A0ABU1UKU5_9ACTN|nr:EAL domain-containing protein [Aeromicrobium panaciterrae]MDR7085775.1 diguanylate cyclase (GGDEF)-like protein/PAS domain S-box-containing protein [Aeromicrobium panaciterrae]